MRRPPAQLLRATRRGRKLFKLAEVARAPLAAEAVRWIDAIFAAERTINGLPADHPASRLHELLPWNWKAAQAAPAAEAA
jgi:MoxR-like ATPase